jgi:DNA-binding transcriptional MocR family regulator
VIHNPLGITMSKSRRQELVRTAQRLKLPIIEDFVYGFLSDEVPIAAMSPERCITITSLSKCVAPGAAVGLIHVPEPMYARVAAAVRGGAWGVSPLALEIGARLMSSGTAQEIAMLKRVDARERQAVVRASLADCEIVADPGSYHLWLMLPDGWRSEAFAAHAARRGVAITPSSAFAMSAGHAPNAVRLALGLPQPQELEWAAAQLAALLRARPHEIDVTE